MSDIPPSIYRDRDLYFFVTSRFIATLAIQVQSVAIGWQIYDMERTPLALGLVGLCQFLPMFLLPLPAGDIPDRFNRTVVLRSENFFPCGTSGRSCDSDTRTLAACACSSTKLVRAGARVR